MVQWRLRLKTPNLNFENDAVGENFASDPKGGNNEEDYKMGIRVFYIYEQFTVHEKFKMKVGFLNNFLLYTIRPVY